MGVASEDGCLVGVASDLEWSSGSCSSISRWIYTHTHTHTRSTGFIIIQVHACIMSVCMCCMCGHCSCLEVALELALCEAVTVEEGGELLPSRPCRHQV